MLKRFVFACLGVLCLAIAYHLGAGTATAQSPAAGKIQLISAAGEKAWVVTENDEIYLIDSAKTTSVAHGDGWVKYKLGVLK
jgi:hypothetical protein